MNKICYNLRHMNTLTIPGINPWLMLLIVLWTIPWKGIALWKSARLSHKWWFIILLIVNTVGILEIIYIFLVARKYNVETMDGEEPEKEPVKMPEAKPAASAPQKELPKNETLKVEEKKEPAEEMSTESETNLEK
jgi:hypothetical protein